MRICLENGRSCVPCGPPSTTWPAAAGRRAGEPHPGDRGGGPDDRDLFHSALELLALALATVPTLRT